MTAFSMIHVLTITIHYSGLITTFKVSQYSHLIIREKNICHCIVKLLLQHFISIWFGRRWDFVQITKTSFTTMKILHHVETFIDFFEVLSIKRLRIISTCISPTDTITNSWIPDQKFTLSKLCSCILRSRDSNTRRIFWVWRLLSKWSFILSSPSCRKKNSRLHLIRPHQNRETVQIICSDELSVGQNLSKLTPFP